jgi:glycosidase
MKLNYLFSKLTAISGKSMLLLAGLAIILSCANQQKEVAEEQQVQPPVQHPEWSKNANIYEVNIRQYTKEGTFNAFQEHLPRLREMGVDILWLMPIHPIGEKNRKGTLGSYYSVKDYKAVNPEYGTMEDFKALVDKGHEMGFRIILDWVANHTAWDNPWIYDHPEWYTKDSTGQMIAPFDWTDVAELDFDNPALRDAMIDALKFWVEEADIDGYRCDVAGEVPTDFWNRAKQELDAVKPVFMLAEAEQTDLHEYAFHMTYAWELHHIYNEIAKGKMNATAIDSYYQKMDTTYNMLNAFRMNFITNHDENSWNGTIEERLGDGAEVFAMLTYTLPGMPLIYSGQESGLDKRLEFFEKDFIEWDYESKWLPFYTKMIQLKHNNEALWNGAFGSEYSDIPTTEEEKILAFERVKGDNGLFIMANLTEEMVNFKLVKEVTQRTYYNIMEGNELEIGTDQQFSLGPWQYYILRFD